MALGKRGLKRSSSSTTSTVTTIVFIGFGVFAVWMLRGDSFAPAKAIINDNNTDTFSHSAFSFSNEPETIKVIEKKDQTVFEDNPGVLPNDAIQTDEPKETQNTDKDAEKNHATSAEVRVESANDKKEKEHTSNGGDGKISDELKLKKIIEESAQGLQGKESAEEQMKQREGETQISEESTLTENQEAYQQHTMQDLESKANEEMIKQQVQEDPGNPTVLQETQNQISDEDKRQTIKQHQEQHVQQKKETPYNSFRDETFPQLQPPSQLESQVENVTKTENQETKLDTNEEKTMGERIKEDKPTNSNSGETIPSGGNTGIPQESTESKKSLSTQATQSEKEEQDVQQKLETPNNSFRDETFPQRQPPLQPESQAENVTKTENQETKPEINKEQTTGERTKEDKPSNSNSNEILPGGSNTGIPKESTESKKSWPTQATQSENEKGRRKVESGGNESSNGLTWLLCNETTGPDFIPCLDNVKAIKKLRSTKHYEHRERHCPDKGPTCLVPLPEGYKIPIAWPKSREKIWYKNVPHAALAQVKGHQNWVKVTGEFLTFPGGGTQFIHGALHYIDFIQMSVPNIAWGKRSRVVLDVGCGVASFGGYLFERDVLTMSFAPKDEHEAQVQFALERGIPAISAVMGSQRLPFPSNVFDLLHCARCRVPWHAEGGKLLMELNRVLRPGGYFVWSATPVYRKLEEDKAIWKAMSNLTVSICWELVTIKMDKLNSAGLAVYRKPSTNECYEKRNHNTPPLCKIEDDPDAAWHVSLQACLHRVHVSKAERGSQWPEEWPVRLQKAPYWLNSSQMGIYGKPTPQDFTKDSEHWKNVVSTLYMSGLGISWSNVRNVMDMRAVYGGFAAALRDLQVWVMNVVNINSPDTLPIIYERGLFGIYHDWCESFSTYPRSYDLLHADHLFSQLKKRCKLVPVIAEVDRLVRPGGKLIVRDESSAIGEIENLLKSLRWEIHLTLSRDQEGILSAQKSHWRPDTYQASS